MKKKDADTVRFQLDPDNLPPLTEAQQAELDALRSHLLASLCGTMNTLHLSCRDGLM